MRHDTLPSSDIEKTYSPEGSLQLFGMKHSIEFCCSRCQKIKVARKIAVSDGNQSKMICNACYGTLLSKRSG